MTDLTPPRTNSKPRPSDRWLAIYNGRVCRGHLVQRGKLGYEAFNTDDGSLGCFLDEHAAVAAVLEWAHWAAAEASSRPDFDPAERGRP